MLFIQFVNLNCKNMVWYLDSTNSKTDLASSGSLMEVYFDILVSETHAMGNIVFALSYIISYLVHVKVSGFQPVFCRRHGTYIGNNPKRRQ